MATASWRNYSTEIELNFDYLATWLPSAAIALGEVGYARRGGFERVGSLSDYGMDITEQEAGDVGSITYASRDAVTVELAAQGGASGIGSGALDISFRRADAVFFSSVECRLRRLLITPALIKTLAARSEAGTWDNNLAIVAETVTAGRTTVLIASSATAMARLSADAGAAATSLGLNELAARARLSRAQDLSLHVAGAVAITPLYRARRLRRSWLGGPSLRSEEADEGDAAIPVVAGITLARTSYLDDPEDT